jgi:hypothetical protein
VTVSPGADREDLPHERVSAGAAGTALALVLCLVPWSATRAQARADTSFAAPADSAAVRPGDAVMAWGPVADSVVRARCEGATVRRVEVRCLDLFDPLPAGRFRGFYSFANKLHVRTRESTVRAQLLIAPGDIWTADRVRESERLLREIGYVEADAIRSRLERDSVDVLVVTHDQWTTRPEINLERGGGKTYGSIGLTEKNLFGLGLGVSFALRQDPAGRLRTASLQGTRLWGGPLEAVLRASTGTAGVANAYSLRDPFRSLDDPRSWTVSWQRGSEDHQLFRAGSLAAQFPFRVEMAQVEYAFGRRVPDGIVRRFALALAMQDRKYGATVTEPGFAGAFPGGEEEVKLRWASARVTLWLPRWIERRGVDKFDPVEDFDVGSLVSMEGGLILRALGSTADEGLARLRFEAGRETRRFGFGFARGRVSTRVRGTSLETLGTLDARWVQQPGRDLALVFAAYGEVADREPREVQSVVGGLNGLRAYPVHALAGTQVWRFNAESRWVAARRVGDLVSLGAALFVDAARAWDPDVEGQPWHHDAGFGLRFSFPKATQNQVARFDVAFPLAPSRDGRREPVFSFGSSQAF